MASLLVHLDDQKWLFYERGMQHWYNWIRRIATGTTQGITGLATIGALEVDVAQSPGLTLAVTPVPNPSGQLDLKVSTQTEYSAGAKPRTAPTKEQDNAA